ncbi:MAG: rhodanese-like domain-containing protein [Terriglobales bacterium]
MEIEITPGELVARLAAQDKIRLIDVREPWEHELVHIAGDELIPMHDIPLQFPELFKDEVSEVVCYCHSGRRSFSVAEWLRRQGMENARSLAGGVDRWALEIDPTLPRY